MRVLKSFFVYNCSWKWQAIALKGRTLCGQNEGTRPSRMDKDLRQVLLVEKIIMCFKNNAPPQAPNDPLCW